MPFWVYILRSESSGRFYCGQTNSLPHRLRQHNDPEHHATKTTKRFQGPWTLVWSSPCATRSEAILLEQKIKKRGIHRFLSQQAPLPQAGC
jgi:putative endonuclease